MQYGIGLQLYAYYSQQNVLRRSDFLSVLTLFLVFGVLCALYMCCGLQGIGAPNDYAFNNHRGPILEAAMGARNRVGID